MPEMTLEEAMQAAMHLDAHAGEHELYPELEKAVREFEDDGYPIGLS